MPFQHYHALPLAVLPFYYRLRTIAIRPTTRYLFPLDLRTLLPSSAITQPPVSLASPPNLFSSAHTSVAIRCDPSPSPSVINPAASASHTDLSPDRDPNPSFPSVINPASAYCVALTLAVAEGTRSPVSSHRPFSDSASLRPASSDSACPAVTQGARLSAHRPVYARRPSTSRRPTSLRASSSHSHSHSHRDRNSIPLWVLLPQPLFQVPTLF